MLHIIIHVCCTHKKLTQLFKSDFNQFNNGINDRYEHKKIQQSIKRHKLLAKQDGFIVSKSEYEKYRNQILDGKSEKHIETAQSLPQCVFIMHVTHCNIPFHLKSDMYLTLHVGDDKNKPVLYN